MVIYGFVVHENGTATLSKMTDVGKGNGASGSRWQCDPVMTGPEAAIVAECSKRNREIAAEALKQTEVTPDPLHRETDGWSTERESVGWSSEGPGWLGWSSEGPGW